MNEADQARLSEIEAEWTGTGDLNWLVERLREALEERDQYWEAYSMSKRRDQALGFSDAARYKAERDDLKDELAKVNAILREQLQTIDQLNAQLTATEEARHDWYERFNGADIELSIYRDIVQDLATQQFVSPLVLRARKAIEVNADA